MNNLNKVLTTLSIASSDTRGDSIKSIILNTLFESASETSYADLIENISILYDIQLYEPELKEALRLLVDNGELLLNQKGYKITENEKNHLTTLEQKIKSEERKRYLNFKTFLDETFDDTISSVAIKLL